jgi:hypothetical protein
MCCNSKEFLTCQDDVGSVPESTYECEDPRIIMYCRYGCFRRCNRVVITLALPIGRSAISVTRINFKSTLHLKVKMICWVCHQKLWDICNCVKSQGSRAVVFNFVCTVFVIKPYIHYGNYIKNTDAVILYHHSLILRNVCIGSGIWISQVFA